MTATAAYPATMPELRGDPAPSSLWSNYGGPVHMSPRIGSTVEPSLANPPSHSPHAGRHRSEQANMDHPAYPYGRYTQEETEPYSPHAPAPGLNTHSGYHNNLKRSFAQTEPAPNPEMAHDLRDDGSRVSVNQDHKLLAFRRSQDKHTTTDQHGRLQQLELSAQLHGMFFLSEMPSSGGDGTALQPELTCYRRNLFQISGSLITPRGPMNVITETGESVPVNSMEVTISAIESVDGNPVRLIVIPWKTPPPNSPEVTQTPDQEPPGLPLIPFQEDGTEAEGEYAVYPIGWRRLQFRIATANNGRRKELQQHFVLHLKVHGTLANNSKVILTESTTAPIVVRGRSPRNFQARKEIPLLGSSAGSRGQALVETGMGVVAGTLSLKQQQEGKPTGSMDMQMPRSAFTFSAPKPPGSQMQPMRSNSYPTWTSPGHGPLPQVPSSSPGSYPATSIGSDMYPKVPVSGSGTYSAEPQEMPLQTSMPPSVPLSLISEEQHQQPMRSQYTYAPSSAAPRQMPMTPSAHGSGDSPSNIPRYVDDGRPAKAPRSAGHQTAPASGSAASSETAPDYRYGSYGQVGSGAGDVLPPHYGTESSASSSTGHRDVYPPTQGWRPTTGEHGSYAGSDTRPYGTSYDQYKSRPSDPQAKAEPGPPGQSEHYGSGHTGSFDNMNNYSWGNS